MGKYREAAQAAYRAVEEQASHLPCLVPANNLIYEFLLEARKIEIMQGSQDGNSVNHNAVHMKRAAEHLQMWPYRVYDAASAQDVKHLGPAIASIIARELFSLYPPEPPSEEELEEQRAQKAALKASKRKPAAPKAGRASAAAAAAVQAGAAGVLGLPGPFPGAIGGGANRGAEQDPDEAELAGGAGPRKRSRKAAGEPKAPKEYIPRIGTANYAFLIVLLEAQKGPNRREYLTKQELMDRAEASGLADKSIRSETNVRQAQVDKSKFYDGWSCLNQQLVNKHALVNAFSNPKKCQLTLKGLALAEELYRDAVGRRKMDPIPGIPTSGPLLYAEEKPPPAAEGPGRWEVPQPAAARPNAAPPAAAAAAAPARRAAPSQQQRGRGGMAAAAAVLSPPAAWAPPAAAAAMPARPYGGMQAPSPYGQLGTGYGHAPAAAATTGYGQLGSGYGHAAAAATTGYGQLGSGYGHAPAAAAGLPARPGLQTGAAAIAAALAAAGAAAPARPPVQSGGSLRAGAGLLSPTAGWGAAAAPVAYGAAAVTGPGYGGTGADRQQQQQQRQRGSGRPQGSSRSSGATEVISLLDDEDDPPPLAARLASRGAPAAALPVAPAAAVLPSRAHGSPAGHGGAAMEVQGRGGVGAASDADLALMVEMGFSDKKARKALRRASNVSEAVEILGDVSSDSEAGSDSDGGGDGFYDASESLPEDEVPAARGRSSPPPLGLNPAIFGGQPAPAGAPQQGHRGASQLAGVRLGSASTAPAAQQLQRAGSQQQLQRAGSQQQQQRWGEYGGELMPAAGAGAGAGGHIRLGSQQQGPSRPLLGSQQSWGGSQSQPGDELTLDQLLQGAGLAPAPARAGAGTTAARPALAAGPAGAGAAGAGARPGGAAAGDNAGGAGHVPTSIRQRAQDLRVPPIPPGQRFQDAYEVVFLVDGREQYSRGNAQQGRTALNDHLDQMRRKGMRVEQRMLRIGDAVWVARSRSNPAAEYVLDYVVERKSVDDLVQSIKSGRYMRQKYWLRKCSLRHVYYLIEGDPDMLPPTEQKQVKTAAATNEVSDQFRVLRTKGHHETFRLYQALTRTIEGLYNQLTAPAPAAASGGQSGSRSLLTFSQWDALMDSITSGNTTLHDVWGLMLSAVTGLGPEAVQAILAHHPTPLSLYNKYRQVILNAAAQRGNAVVAARSALAGLRREGAARGLGPDKAAKVYDLLFMNGWNLLPGA